MSEQQSTVEALGYSVSPANPAQRIVQSIAASSAGGWLLQRTLYPVDKQIYRLTNGKVSVPELLTGLPVIMLTTTGAKTGKSRTMPIVGVPIEGSIAVVGSNYGQSSTPGWIYNLRSDPAAMISYRGREVAVHARSATSTETEAAFATAAPIYPGFSKYRERANHREIQVFLLDVN
jgi:deazaflavin-dependent oxidoreductase (nitroreductase family)